MNEIKLIEPTIEYAEDIWQFRQEIMDSSDNDKFAGCGPLEESQTALEWIETVKTRSSADTCPKDVARRCYARTLRMRKIAELRKY